WLAANLRPGDHVGLSGLPVNLPRLRDDVAIDVATIDDLRAARPRFYVLNADYARSVPPDDAWGQLIAGLEHGTLGYRLLRGSPTSSPWPWLPGGHPDLVGDRTETPVFSTLRNVNPTIDVFEIE